MLDIRVRARFELIGDDPASGDGLERDGSDKPRGRRRHHGDHLVAALLQAACDLDGLVRADAAGDAEGDEHYLGNRFAVPFDFFDVCLADDFLLGDGCLLVLADADARRGTGEQLARAGAGRYDELE